MALQAVGLRRPVPDVALVAVEVDRDGRSGSRSGGRSSHPSPSRAARLMPSSNFQSFSSLPIPSLSFPPRPGAPPGAAGLLLTGAREDGRGGGGHRPPPPPPPPPGGPPPPRRARAAGARPQPKRLAARTTSVPTARAPPYRAPPPPSPPLRAPQGPLLEPGRPEGAAASEGVGRASVVLLFSFPPRRRARRHLFNLQLPARRCSSPPAGLLSANPERTG